MLGRPAAPVADRVFGPPEDPRMYQLIEETLGTEMHGVTERKLQVPTEVLLDVGNPIRNNPHQSPNSLYGWYEYKPSRNGEMVGLWHWIAHKLFFKRSQALNTIAQLGA